MRLLICICLVFIGCAKPQSEYDAYVLKIKDWQQREALCDPEIIDFTYETDFPCITCLLSQFKKIEYKSNPYYWQTSEETILKQEANCTAAAILSLRAIKKSSLYKNFDFDVRIRVLKTNGEINHIIAVVYFENLIFEVDNFTVITGERDNDIIIEFDENIIF